MGASALVTSPSACACLSSAQVVAFAAGLNVSWVEAAELSAAQVELGLQRHLVGRIPDPRELFPSKDFGCTTSARATVECFVETDQSWALAKGWLVTLERAPDGTITRALVVTTWRHRPNNSFNPMPLRGTG